MGNKCTTCNTCGKYDTVEFLFGNFYLEDFQNVSVPLANLDRYDIFYRLICNPLPQLTATEFFTEIEVLCENLDLDHQARSKFRKIASKETHWKNQKHFADSLPLEKFINQFKNQNLWKDCLKNEKSPILLLLKIPGLLNETN